MACAAASAKPYETLLADHVKDYQSLFDRVSLDLGSDRAKSSCPPTSAWSISKPQGPDHGLEALLFQYGRYLLISSSRPGGLPANLQGRWNQSNTPPWRSDYHTDINVQMNYWPAGPANLNECFLPYADWLNSIRGVRTDETKAAFHTRGWTMHAENGIFGGSTWQWVESGSAWCAQNLWEHYAFTGDKEYLRSKAYPMMKEICEFWLDRLKTLPDGTLVAPNGYSPEHGPREDGVSHDQQLVWDLFSNTIEAADALGIDKEFRDTLAARREKLLGPEDRPLGSASGVDGRSRRPQGHAPPPFASRGRASGPADFSPRHAQAGRGGPRFAQRPRRRRHRLEHRLEDQSLGPSARRRSGLQADRQFDAPGEQLAGEL